MKHIEKKLDGNCTRMLQVILNKSWKHHPIKQLLYSHQPPISKIIQIRLTRHVGYCRRSRDELISDVLLLIPHMDVQVLNDQQEHLQQICMDTGYNLEDLLEVIDDRDR